MRGGLRGSMKRAVILFALVGGVGVPVVFTLAGWLLRSFAPASPDALALLRDVQLPLWPMSKLLLDDRSGRHWMYLPLATLLSNALLYAAAGAIAAIGRRRVAVFGALVAAVVGMLCVASRGFGSGPAGLAVAALLAVAGLAMHHRAGTRPRR